MAKKEKIILNNLHYLALKFSEQLTKPEERRKENLTMVFWEHIQSLIKDGHLVSIGIIGDVTYGKSALALKIAQVINEHFLNKKMKTEFVQMDQIDFVRKVRKETEKHVCYVIDEWSTISETGQNATIEDKFFRTFNQTCAQEYIYRVSASPDEIQDKSAKIILNVVEINKDTKETTAFLSYKLKEVHRQKDEQIGYIRINVGDILETKWYKAYRVKKETKMNFLRNKGFRDARDLIFSEIVLESYEEMKDTAELEGTSIPIISGYLEETKESKGEVFSIITETELIQKVKGLLDRRVAIIRNKKRLNRLKDKYIQKQDQRLANEIKKLERAIKKSTNNLLKAINRLQEKKEIYKKYVEL